jgi:hypothetical protein
MNKMKITLAAALVAAAFATPALAQDLRSGNGRHHVRSDLTYSTRAPRLIEGRNAVVRGNFGGTSGSSTSRGAMVEELGN